MKVTIDFSDFYVEEGDIAAELKREIISQAVAEIRNQMKEQIQVLVHTEIRSQINDTVILVIKEHVSELIATGMVSRSSYDKNQVAIKDEIERMFNSTNSWGINAKETIAAIAKGFGESMKKRYDLIFASEVVANMQKQGFLKDDIADKLLN